MSALEELRAELFPLSTRQRVARLAAMPPSAGGDPAIATRRALALTRLRNDPRTRAYAQRRTTQGKTTKDIMRCLKRSIARELFPVLKADLDHDQQPALTWGLGPSSPRHARSAGSLPKAQVVPLGQRWGWW